MTIKKIVLSTLATTLLSTSAFAATSQTGTLSYIGDENPTNVVVGTELASTGSTTLDLNSFDLNAAGAADVLTFSVVADGSGTVSDPTFVYVFPGDVSAALNVAGNSIVDFTLVVPAVVATVSDVQYDAVSNTTTARFEGDSAIDVLTGHNHVITDGGLTLADALAITSTITSTIASEEISVTLYSTSGTEEERTVASISPFSTADQYEFNCITKLDGMINYENSSLSFVPTGHGIDNTVVGSTDLAVSAAPLAGIDGISDANTDAFIFTVTNNILTNNIDLGMNGLGTIVTLTGDATANVNTMVTALTGDLVRVDTAASVGGLTTAANVLSYEFTAVIPAGTTTYVASAVTDYTAGLEATTWDAAANIDEANLATYATPAIGSGVSSAGEWMDYTYIAQIPAVTQDATVSTKFFIANRSCASVAPTFKLIQAGVVTTVTMATEIAADAQGLYKMVDILDQAGLAANSGKYAVEVVLPGLAEDFYVAAQAKNDNLGQFKDLPVYSTSARN